MVTFARGSACIANVFVLNPYGVIVPRKPYKNAPMLAPARQNTADVNSDPADEADSASCQAPCSARRIKQLATMSMASTIPRMHAVCGRKRKSENVEDAVAETDKHDERAGSFKVELSSSEPKKHVEYEGHGEHGYHGDVVRGGKPFKI